MTRTPEVLLETQASPSDSLSDLLEGMRLSGVVLFRAEFSEPWFVTTPDCRVLAGVLPFRTEHMIPFHVVASGECRIEMPGSEPVWLKEGDVVCIPYGGSHRLGDASAPSRSRSRRYSRTSHGTRRWSSSTAARALERGSSAALCSATN